MLIRRAILFPVLCTYLLVTSLAGQGRVVICHDVEGRIAIEAEGSGCCSREPSASGDLRLIAAERQTCDLCIDIPLGEMPSRASTESVSAAKASPGDILPFPALPASGPAIFPLGTLQHQQQPPTSDLRSGVPALLLQGIVMRC